jgi:hypothetical protein
MSATGDTIAAVQSFIRLLQEAAASANAAASQAEKSRAMAGALGDARSVAAFTQVHELLVLARRALGPAVERADQAIARTKSIEGGG